MKKIVMLGTAFDTRGGIAAVVNTYRNGGLFERWPVEYLATHGDGSSLFKLRLAATAWARFVWLLATGQVGLVHVHSASGPSFWRKTCFILAAFVARKPVIFHLHGGGFARFYESRSGPIRRRIIRYVLRHATLLLVLTESWRLWIEKAAGRVDAVVIPNPVAVPVKVHREASPPFILFLGMLSQEKGVYDLLTAFSRIISKHPGLRLVCAGEGDIAGLHSQCAALGMAGVVDFPGWVGEGDKNALLAGAAAFVLPSYYEGMPMSLLEAMAWGVPVVATRVGGVEDVITDQVNGILVSPGDIPALMESLDALLSHSDLRELLGNRGKNFVLSKFGSEQVIEKISRIYASAGFSDGGCR
jgi:glycosyltransferase involved in cell wall biosynthesis